VGIGGSIFLIAVGAILAFAVNAEVGWLSLSTVGWVLMLVGLAGLIFTLWFWQRRRTVVASPPVDRVVERAPVDRVVERTPVVERRAPVVERRVEERREVGPTDVY